jgi:selenocysteine lyase/cysteine desulfurase
VTGWLLPLADIVAVAHRRRIPVLVDAAQLAPYRPLPAKPDFVAWGLSKMYPRSARVPGGPRRMLAVGDPLRVGGAAPVLDLDDVTRMVPPDGGNQAP